MATPLVSALIVTRRPAFVAGAVAMMRAQAYPRVEVVVILHGVRPSDLPLEGRDALAGADYVLEVPASVPLGTCMNIATAASRGEVLAKIDDDDLYGPAYFEEAVASLRAGKGPVIGKTEFYVYLERERELLLWRPGTSKLDQPELAGGTLLYPRQLGLNPGYRAIPCTIDHYFLEDCEALGHRSSATSRSSYVLRRMAMTSHHTWQVPDDHFRHEAIVVRRNLADDSPAALLRLVGGV
jgi:hypothetical protein